MTSLPLPQCGSATPRGSALRRGHYQRDASVQDEHSLTVSFTEQRFFSLYQHPLNAEGRALSHAGRWRNAKACRGGCGSDLSC